MATRSDKSQTIGEGNREADRHYREKTREFVKSGKVDEAAKKAGDKTEKELQEAEAKGRERAKELDPAVHRDYEKSEPT